jgi:transcriptional regulator with XRE-family HTH domain
MPSTARTRRVAPFPSLGAYLAAARISQAELARRVKTSQAQISRIVAGDQVPRPRLLARIVKHTNVAPGSFARIYLARQRRPNKRRAA